MPTSMGSKSRQSKVEELGGILDKMRVQSKTKESNLENALEDLKKDPKRKREYWEAKGLLNEVQTKYDEVRMVSLKPTTTAFKLFGTRPEDRRNSENDKPDEAVQEAFGNLGHDKNMAKELKRFRERVDSRL